MNTMQQEFDFVITHLYKQGRPAKTKDDGCLYRYEGLSCAVGCRIPDSIYRPDMDTNVSGTGVRTILKLFGDVLPPEIRTYADMFERLQTAHDSCALNEDGTFNIQVLNTNLRHIADCFGIDFTKQEVA